jgi:ATP phosphoribosyltransferase
MNVAGEDLDRLIPLLPCMKSPTVAELYGEQGYAVKIAVEKEKVASLIPFLKENGATDILVYNINKVVP